MSCLPTVSLSGNERHSGLHGKVQDAERTAVVAFFGGGGFLRGQHTRTRGARKLCVAQAARAVRLVYCGDGPQTQQQFHGVTTRNPRTMLRVVCQTAQLRESRRRRFLPEVSVGVRCRALCSKAERRYMKLSGWLEAGETGRWVIQGRSTVPGT